MVRRPQLGLQTLGQGEIEGIVGAGLIEPLRPLESRPANCFGNWKYPNLERKNVLKRRSTLGH